MEATPFTRTQRYDAEWTGQYRGIEYIVVLSTVLLGDEMRTTCITVHFILKT